MPTRLAGQRVSVRISPDGLLSVSDGLRLAGRHLLHPALLYNLLSVHDPAPRNSDFLLCQSVSVPSSITLSKSSELMMPTIRSSSRMTR